MAKPMERPKAVVISLPGQRAGSGDGDGDVLAAVERYWQRLQDGAGGDNSRARLDPRGFSRALSDSFIAEPVSGRELRLRVAGQNLGVLAGTDLRGVPLSLLFLPEARPALEDAVEQVLAGTPVRLTLSAPRGPFRPVLHAGLLLLPLAAEQGSPRRVLGALATSTEAGRRPCRFRIATPPNRAPVGRSGAPMMRLIPGGLSTPV